MKIKIKKILICLMCAFPTLVSCNTETKQEYVVIQYIYCNHDKYVNEHIFEAAGEYRPVRYYPYNFNFNEEYYQDLRMSLPTKCGTSMINHGQHFLYIDEDTKFMPHVLTESNVLNLCYY